MEIVNGRGYSDDLDRVEHVVETIISMHTSYGISMEEAAGRFDRYAQEAMGFVKSEMFFHATPDELAQSIYYGKSEWELRNWWPPPQPLPYP